MKDSQILSAFHAPPPAGTEPGPRAPRPPAPLEALRLDTCQAGVVLRAVLFVQGIVLVASLFKPGDLRSWIDHTLLLTGAAQPAVVGWLLVVCVCKKLLQRLPLRAQWALVVVLGALAGLYGCALPWWLGLLQPAPWLASAAAGALVSAVVVAGMVWRERARMPAGTTARLIELQARIRPHFLFNTLNSAIALVRAEPAKAENLLADLSELFRHALADAQEPRPLAQELALAEHYLAIEQVRFGERLRVEWSLDPAAAQARLPPLVLQPLVENAVKHGVEPSPSGATLRISTQRRAGVVVIKVSNTVPAGTGARGHGLALDNVRQRLSLLHDVQCDFRSALVDGVFQVRIEVPA